MQLAPRLMVHPAQRHRRLGRLRRLRLRHLWL
jgi:hypothetical protein